MKVPDEEVLLSMLVAQYMCSVGCVSGRCICVCLLCVFAMYNGYLMYLI